MLGAAYQPKGDKTSSAKLANRFGYLELQEPAQWLSDSTITHAPSTGQAPSIETQAPDVQLSGLSNDEEAAFGRACFFFDCQRVRNYIRSIWADYRQHSMSLITVALTTNMAFDVIDRLHADFARAFPEHADYEELAQALSEYSKLPSPTEQHQQGTVPASTHTSDPDRSEASMSCSKIVNVLEHLREGYEAGAFRDFPMDKNSFDWSTECLPEPGPDTVETILTRAIPDIVCFICLIGGKNSFADEFSCSVFDFHQAHKVSVPLVVACQIFVDVHFVLLHDIKKSFCELQSSAAHIGSAMKKSEVQTKISKYDGSFPKTREAFTNLKDLMEHVVNKDAVAAYRRTNIKPIRDNLTPFCLLKHHPTVCGMTKFYLDRTLCVAGLRMCNEWHCLIGMVHLYNALIQSGHLDVPWPDMDAIIDFYGSDYLFIGSPPSSLEDYDRRHRLAAGMPPSALSPDSRLKHSQTQDGVFSVMRTSTQTGRLFEVKQPLSTIMRERFSLKKGKREPGMVIRDVEIAVNAMQSPINGSDKSTRISKQWKDHHVLSPTDLLEAIRQGIQAEELHMQFDFLTFNRRCLEFLRRLRDRLNRDLPQVPWDTNERLETVITLILGIASQDEVAALACLHFTGLSLKELIQREGANEIERARERCCQSKQSTTMAAN